jgi:hypothetical protein
VDNWLWWLSYRLTKNITKIRKGDLRKIINILANIKVIFRIALLPAYIENFMGDLFTNNLHFQSEDLEGNNRHNWSPSMAVETRLELKCCVILLPVCPVVSDKHNPKNCSLQYKNLPKEIRWKIIWLFCQKDLSLFKVIFGRSSWKQIAPKSLRDF